MLRRFQIRRYVGQVPEMGQAQRWGKRQEWTRLMFDMRSLCVQALQVLITLRVSCVHHWRGRGGGKVANDWVISELSPLRR